MIEMGMREHDGIDGFGQDRKRRPVTQAQVFEALEHSAINQDALAVHLEQVPGAGDRPGGSEKR
jgi:hypothetical protein